MDIKKISNYFIVVWNIVLILITIFIAKGYIRFGLGLGDGFIFLISIFFILMVDISYLLSLKSKGFFNRNQKFIILFASVYLLWIILKMTIFRGALSVWDGKLFFW